MFIRKTFCWLALSALALASAPSLVSAQKPLTRDLLIDDQKPLNDLEAPKSDLSVTAWVDRVDESYKTGDVMQLFVKPNQDAYITVVDVGTSGKVHVLFPNKHQRDNRVLAHQVLQIPGPDAQWRIKVGGPAGHELIKIIATQKPEAVINPERLADLGPIYQYRSTVQTLTRDLSVEINEKHRGTSATFEKIVRILADQSGLPPRLQPGSGNVPQPPAANAIDKLTPPKASLVTTEDLYRLGEAHFYGDGGRANHREALKYLTAAADGGHVGAMYFIGRIHEVGQDVDQSAARAMTWYRKSAELGNTQAMVRLAMLYANKDGVSPDIIETARWLKKAASQADGMAMIHLARMSDEGIGVERAPRDAARYLLSALKTGAWTVVDQVAKFSEETRRELQTQLSASGHYRGPVEGRIGAETRAAMVEWAKAG